MHAELDRLYEEGKVPEDIYRAAKEPEREERGAQPQAAGGPGGSGDRGLPPSVTGRPSSSILRDSSGGTVLFANPIFDPVHGSRPEDRRQVTTKAFPLAFQFQITITN